MRPQSVAVSSQAASAPIVVDGRRAPFSAGFGVLVSAGASLTYSVEHTFDDLLGGVTAAAATWYANATVAAQTTSKDGNYAYNVTGIRLNVTTWVSGTATLTVVQGTEH